MNEEILEAREEPLPPPASLWLLTSAAILLAGSALLHLFLIRMGLEWGTLPRLATTAFQAILIGAIFIQIGWRRPFALYLWVLFIVFLIAFVWVVSSGLASHHGPPIWAQ